MFIPYSVWEQSHGLNYGVFELIEADIIHEMMKDIFQSNGGIQNNFILDPFSLRIQYGFRNYYNLNVDDYKYRIAVENEKLRLNFRPKNLVDIMYFQNYLEASSYRRDLQRFRPLIRIQSFINYRKKQKNGLLPKDLEAKRQAVIRDWFRLIIWYVRLRKASKNFVPIKLLKVELRRQKEKLKKDEAHFRQVHEIFEFDPCA